MATVTLPEMRAYIYALIHGTAATQPLESFWTPQALLAIGMAKSDVYGALLGRGFTAAQIEGGDAFKVVWEAQSLFWCLHLNRAYASTEDAASLNKLDQRAQLATMPWVVDGVVVEPGATGVRQSSSGSFAHPATGSVRNPLLDVPRRCGDVPYPTW